jgi:hypothetical protein
MTMEKGLLYVVFNKWIKNPETGEMPHKIGITRTSVKERYYGLGLKMPGEFETVFAYNLDDYEKAEKSINDILTKYHVNGEWYNLDQEKLELIESICKTMGGEPITDEFDDEIIISTESSPETEYDDEINEGTLKIKGVEVPLCKKKNELTQDFVKRILRLFFNNDFIPDTEIRNMLEKDYCIKTFGIAFPIIQNDPNKLLDRKGHSRYWKERIGNYYICSQWWKQKENMYRKKLSKWIMKINDCNK